MVSALLLFLTLPFVFSVDPKCPEGFHYFKRAPTAWNNYTKEWCLGVIDGKEDCGNRDFARSICINHNATISMPENKHEFEVITNTTGAKKAKTNHAIDGQMSPRCVNKYMKQHFWFEKELFLFDDINTDPSYILDYSPDSPNHVNAHQVNETTSLVKYISSCLTIMGGQIQTEFCFGQQMNEYNSKAADIRTVVCGRPPM